MWGGELLEFFRAFGRCWHHHETPTAPGFSTTQRRCLLMVSLLSRICFLEGYGQWHTRESNQFVSSPVQFSSLTNLLTFWFFLLGLVAWTASDRECTSGHVNATRWEEFPITNLELCLCIEIQWALLCSLL